MRTTGEDGRAGRGTSRSGSFRRVAGLTVGCLAAAGATAVVFLSDDPQILRIAVVAVAWACLLAAFAAARPSCDDDGRGAGTGLGADLRAAHAGEPDAARESGRERSDRVRRDTEDAVRRQLDALRGELAGLREGLAGLDVLRHEVAAVGALQGELRGELAGLAGLRADVGRLRTELSGQLSGEMRVERVVVHAQSVRSGPGREPLEPATAAWSADVARKLSGSWPEVPVAPATVAVEAARIEPAPEPQPEPQPGPRPAPPARPLPAVPVPPPAREVLDDALPVPPAADRAPLTRRRTDLHTPATYEQPTVQRPAVHAAAAGHAGATAAPLVPGAHPAPAGSSPGEPGADRLAQILAESGVTPGGRRRRYRDG